MISKNNVLALKSRQDIFSQISKYPGIHFSELSRKSKIPKSTLTHHLKYLTKEDIIDSKDQGRYKRYYVKFKLGKREKEIINLLREKIPRHIIFLMFVNTVCSQIELSKELKIQPAAISFHLKKLLDLGLIEVAPVIDGKIFLHESYILVRSRVGNELIYRFTRRDTFTIIYHVLIAYKDSLPDLDLIEDVIWAAEEGLNEEEYLVIKSGQDYIDYLIEFFDELFPIPICA
ncbi:MAG: ArsR family transcriptional regulator [Thermoplasmatales archaeon]|nr:ArsR family transcriptional regulator [Thermoplasmatales archaeon]